MVARAHGGVDAEALFHHPLAGLHRGGSDGALAALVPKLVQATVGDEHRAAVARMLATTGPGAGAQPGDLARATLLAVSSLPAAFHRAVRQVGGVPYAAMYPILEEAPRYLHWLASQGLLGTVHPWCAIVAADLERRIRWRYLQPVRGSGRLLWACEQMATPVHLDEAVPRLWAAARARGHRGPDWRVAGRPRDCQLDPEGYLALLRERVTDATLVTRNGQVRATGPSGAVLAVWTGAAHRILPLRSGEVTVDAPDPAAGAGAAMFTWRGDYRGSGWLAAYNEVREPISK